MDEHSKIVVIWIDGSHKVVNSNEAWEYENDIDWLVSIPIDSLINN